VSVLERGLPAELLRRRRAVVGVVLAVLLVVGVVLLIGKAAGYARLAEELRDARKEWLALCFAAETAAYAGYTSLLRGVFRWGGGPALDFGLAARVVFGSLGATQLVASAGAGGLAVTYWALRRGGFDRREALARVIGGNTIAWLVLAAAAWLAALLTTLHVCGRSPLGIALPWLAVVPFCVIAARFVTAQGRVERLERDEGGWLRRAFAVAVSGTAFVRRVVASAEGPRILAGAAVYWLGDAACLWAGLRAFGVDLPVAELVLAYATGYLATVLPLPLSGAGGFDAAMTYALVAVGVPLAPALLGVVAYRLFAFWLPTIPAGISLALLPRTGRDLERARLFGS
jgi:putative heme transporter